VAANNKSLAEREQVGDGTTAYMSVLPGKVVNIDIRANEILTQPDDEQWAMLVRPLAVVVGRAENPAEITAWSKESIEAVAGQCFKFKQARLKKQ
jgi:hypothetical protein